MTDQTLLSYLKIDANITSSVNTESAKEVPLKSLFSKAKLLTLSSYSKILSYLNTFNLSASHLIINQHDYRNFNNEFFRNGQEFELLIDISYKNITVQKILVQPVHMPDSEIKNVAILANYDDYMLLTYQIKKSMGFLIHDRNYKETQYRNSLECMFKWMQSNGPNKIQNFSNKLYNNNLWIDNTFEYYYAENGSIINHSHTNAGISPLCENLNGIVRQDDDVISLYDEIDNSQEILSKRQKFQGQIGDMLCDINEETEPKICIQNMSQFRGIEHLNKDKTKKNKSLTKSQKFDQSKSNIYEDPVNSYNILYNSPQKNSDEQPFIVSESQGYEDKELAELKLLKKVSIISIKNPVIQNLNIPTQNNKQTKKATKTQGHDHSVELDRCAKIQPAKKSFQRGLSLGAHLHHKMSKENGEDRSSSSDDDENEESSLKPFSNLPRRKIDINVNEFNDPLERQKSALIDKEVFQIQANKTNFDPNLLEAHISNKFKRSFECSGDQRIGYNITKKDNSDGNNNDNKMLSFQNLEIERSVGGSSFNISNMPKLGSTGKLSKYSSRRNNIVNNINFFSTKLIINIVTPQGKMESVSSGMIVLHDRYGKITSQESFFNFFMIITKFQNFYGIASHGTMVADSVLKEHFIKFQQEFYDTEKSEKKKQILLCDLPYFKISKIPQIYLLTKSKNICCIDVTQPEFKGFMDLLKNLRNSADVINDMLRSKNKQKKLDEYHKKMSIYLTYLFLNFTKKDIENIIFKLHLDDSRLRSKKGLDPTVENFRITQYKDFRYEGWMINNNKIGKGISIYNPDDDENNIQTIYGHYLQNKKHGQFNILYNDNKECECVYDEDVLNGRYILFGDDNMPLIMRNYCNGNLDGICEEYEIVNGERKCLFKGNYKKGKRNGFCFVILNESGKIYNGNYKNDLFHGQGKMIYEDGSQYNGCWKDGLRDGYGEKTGYNGHCGVWLFDKPIRCRNRKSSVTSNNSTFERRKTICAMKDRGKVGPDRKLDNILDQVNGKKGWNK